jgi:hypothetical protein
VTILIAIFNESFSSIISNAHEEFLFLMCIKTVEEIQSDELFEYMPPFNLFQVAVLLPLKQVIPAKMFLKLNRAIMCIVFFPFLLLIYLWEVFSFRLNKDNTQQVMVQRTGSIKPMYRRTLFRARTRSSTAVPRISLASAVPPSELPEGPSTFINIEEDAGGKYGSTSRVGKQKQEGSSATLFESPTEEFVETATSTSRTYDKDAQLAEIKQRCEALEAQIQQLLAIVREIK